MIRKRTCSKTLAVSGFSVITTRNYCKPIRRVTFKRKATTNFGKVTEHLKLLDTGSRDEALFGREISYIFVYV